MINKISSNSDVSSCASIGNNNENDKTVQPASPSSQKLSPLENLQKRTSIQWGKIKNAVMTEGQRNRKIDFNHMTTEKARQLIDQLEGTKAGWVEGSKEANFIEKTINSLKNWLAKDSSSTIAESTEKITYHSYWAATVLRYLPILDGPFVRIADFQMVTCFALVLSGLTSTVTLIKETLYMNLYEKWMYQTGVKRIEHIGSSDTAKKVQEMLFRIKHEGLQGPTYKSFCEDILSLYTGSTLNNASSVITKLKDWGLYDSILTHVASQKRISSAQAAICMECNDPEVHQLLSSFLKEQIKVDSGQHLYQIYRDNAVNNFKNLCKILIASKHTIGHTFMQVRLATAAIFFPLSVIASVLVILENFGLVSALIGMTATLSVTGVGIILVTIGIAYMYHYRKETLDVYMSIHIRLLWYDIVSFYYQCRKKLSSSLDTKIFDIEIQELKAKSIAFQKQFERVGVRDFQKSIGIDSRHNLAKLIAEGFLKYEQFLSKEDKALFRKEMGTDFQHFFAMDEDAMILFIQSVFNREEIDLAEILKDSNSHVL